MEDKQSQTGSAHAIIIILLVIALLGGLGFVFWQNFAKSKSETKQTKTAQNSVTANKSSGSSAKINEVKLTEIAADHVASTNLAIKYPSSWIMTHEQASPVSDGDITVVGENYNISSPNKEIVVKLGLTNGGVGGTCDKTNGDGLLQINPEEIPNYPNTRFVSYYGADYYFAGIQSNDEKNKSIKVGDSVCDLGLTGVITPIKSNLYENVNLLLSIEFPTIGHNGKSSVEKFKQSLTTEDYKIAKRIIESLYVKDN